MAGHRRCLIQELRVTPACARTGVSVSVGKTHAAVGPPRGGRPCLHCHDGIAASLTHIPCLQTAQEDKQVPHQKGHKDVAAHIAAHALLSQVTGPARRPAASIKQDRKKAPLRRRRRVIRRAEPSRAPQSPGQAAGNGRLRPQYHPAIPSAHKPYAPMGSILTNFECSYIIIL